MELNRVNFLHELNSLRAKDLVARRGKDKAESKEELVDLPPAYVLGSIIFDFGANWLSHANLLQDTPSLQTWLIWLLV